MKKILDFRIHALRVIRGKKSLQFGSANFGVGWGATKLLGGGG